MYRFIAYALDVNDTLHPQMFKTRAEVEQACAQNNLDKSAIVQLFRFKNLSTIAVPVPASPVVDTPGESEPGTANP